MKESNIKDYLTEEAAKRGLLCIKLAPTGDNGWPDWLVLGLYGVHGFIELKRPGKQPNPLQVYRLSELTRWGHLAEWADSLAGVRSFLDKLSGVVGHSAGEAVPASVRLTDVPWSGRGRGATS